MTFSINGGKASFFDAVATQLTPKVRFLTFVSIIHFLRLIIDRKFDKTSILDDLRIIMIHEQELKHVWHLHFKIRGIINKDPSTFMLK